jgi:Ca-activated chloride channel homolog
MVLRGRVLVLLRSCLVLGGFCCWGIAAAHAQAEIPDVHIQPRLHSSGNQNLSNGYVDTIRKHVDLVLVPVTITDQMQRIVVGLDKENFQVYEGKEPQELKHFSSEDAPASLGVILDMSSSMSSKSERAREAVIELLKASNPQDEVFLITFGDAPHLVQDFTRAVEDIQ